MFSLVLSSFVLHTCANVICIELSLTYLLITLNISR